MLENISKYITPEIYSVLYYAGHLDDIVLADVNYPCNEMCAKVIHSECPDNGLLLEEFLKYLPIDIDRENPFCVISENESIYKEPSFIIKTFEETINEIFNNKLGLNKIKREEFYRRTKNAYAIIQTNEYRPFGTIIITKGMILKQS